MKLFNFFQRYDVLILILGIILSLIGLFLNINANSLLLGIISDEKKISNSGEKSSTEELQTLFDRKITASEFSYTGVILLAIGFIFANVLHVYIIYRGSKL